MNPNNWVLWLVIGIAVGWLIEFLVDYFFFGRRNRELESQLTGARLDAGELHRSVDEIKTGLAQAVAVQTALQAKIEDLETTVATSTGNLQMLAAGGGLVGALGETLLRGDREGLARTMAGLEEALAAREPLEQTVQELQSSASALEAELGRTQAALQRQADEYGVRDAGARRNLDALMAAGGLLGALGAALAGGDESTIRRAIAAIEVELVRKPEVVQVEVADKREVEALKAQLAEAVAKQEALQMEADDLSARAIATVSRIGLVTAAGGVLGDLGAALASGDESAVLAGVSAVKRRMARGSVAKPNPTSQTEG